MVALCVAIPAITHVYSRPAAMFATGGPGPPVLHVLPKGLGLALFFAVLSRVAGFVPGYVFGRMASYVAVRVVSRRAERGEASSSAPWPPWRLA